MGKAHMESPAPNGGDKPEIERSIKFVKGELAIRIEPTSVDFVLDSLKSWGDHFGHERPHEALLLFGESKKPDSPAARAYVVEHTIVRDALRHRFDISHAEERTTASMLLAQFGSAEHDHQQHVEALHTSFDIFAMAQSGDPRSVPAV